MSIVKIITNFFTNKEDINKSTVEIVIETSKKSESEMFDEAVMEVTKRKLASAIKTQLTESLYTKEEIEQTKLAADEFGVCLGYYSVKQRNEINKKYPKARLNFNRDLTCYVVELDFNIDNFIENLVNKAMSKELK